MRCILVLVASFCALTKAREFQFYNKLSTEVWIGCLGNPGFENLSNGSWKLGRGQQVRLQAQDNWQGRFWARTNCNPRTMQCETGHCGNRLQCSGASGEPPAILTEFTLQGKYGLDYYDISLVDGYNVKMAITPVGGRSNGGRYSCVSTGCDYEINQDCPNELRQIGSYGQVSACKSACNAFKTHQYCCEGAYNRPATCKSSRWPINYPKFFKDRCPEAYSYAYDDQRITFTCNAPAYLITIG